MDASEKIDWSVVPSYSRYDSICIKVEDARNVLDLIDTLCRLHDLQNSYPPEKYREEWERTMARTRKLLAEVE